MSDNITSPILDNPFISDNSIIALDIDTKNRFNLVHNSGGSDPIPYPMPSIGGGGGTNPSQQDLLSNNYSNGSIYGALNSPNQSVRNRAAQIIKYKNSAMDPAFYGIGVKQKVKYDPVMDKYIYGKYGYSPSLGIQGNEDLYYRDYLSQNLFQRALTNTGVFLGRLGTGIAAKTVATFGYMGSMIGNGIQELFDPTGNNAMADISNNSLSRWAEVNWEENWKNSPALSVFKPSDWEEKGFFQKLGNAAFWTDEIADGAAFMGEMVLSTYLTGGLGKIAGLGKLGATGINTASKLSKLPSYAGKAGSLLGKGIDWTLKIGTGADDVAGIGRWAFLTTSESAVEAAQKYRVSKEEMYRKRDQGVPEFANMSDFQIDNEAGDIAATVFRGNMAILSVSNAFENRLIFNKIFKNKRPEEIDRAVVGTAAAERIAIEGAEKGAAKATKIGDVARASMKEYKYSTKLGKYFDWKNSLSRSRFYGSMGLRAFGMEGLWEENAQLAIERISSDQHFRKMGFPSQFGSIVSRSGKQIIDAFTGNDVDAETAIGLGALIGIGGGAVVTKVFGGEKLFTGERKQIIKDTEKSIQRYEVARLGMFSFLDMWKKDANGKFIRENGELVIDPEAAEKVLKNLYNNLDFQTRIDEIENPAIRQHLMDKMMQDYVWAAKKAGIFDRSIKSIERIKDYSPEEAAELGFDPNSMVDHTQVIENLQNVGKRYDEVYNNSRNKTYTNNQDIIDDENRKYWSFIRKSTIDSLKRTLSAYNQEFDEQLVQDISFEEPGRSRSDLQELNSLRMMLATFEKYEDQKLKFLNTDYSKKIADFVKLEKEKVKKRIDEIYELYKKDIKDGKIVDTTIVKEDNVTPIYTYQDGTAFKVMIPTGTVSQPRYFISQGIGELESLLLDNAMKDAFKVAELKNSLILEDFHDNQMDVKNDKSLENYRSFKEYVDTEGKLILLTLSEDRIAETKRLIKELEDKETKTPEEEKQLLDYKDNLQKLEEAYKKQKEEFEKKAKPSQAAAQPAEPGQEPPVQEEEEQEEKEEEQTEEEKLAEEEKKRKEEQKDNERIDNIIATLTALKNDDIDQYEDEKDEDEKIQIAEKLVIQLIGVKNVEVATERLIELIKNEDNITLENNLISILLMNDNLTTKFQDVIEFLDEVDLARKTANNTEKRKKEIQYSIDQIESKLEDKINNLVANGASREAAEKIAYDELPDEDKEELRKLKDQLALLEESVPGEEVGQEPPPTAESTEVNIQEELDKLEKENTKSSEQAPAAPVSGKKASVKGTLTEQGTSLELEVVGDTGKEFLLTVDRKGNISLFSEKQPDGSYKSGEPASKEVVINLYKKYVPSTTILKIQKWLASFTGSWAAPETQDGKNNILAEKELIAELAALEGAKPSTTPTTNIEAEKQKLIEERDQRIKEEAPTKDLSTINVQFTSSPEKGKGNTLSSSSEMIERYDKKISLGIDFIKSRFKSIEEAYNFVAEKDGNKINYDKLRERLTSKLGRTPTKEELDKFVLENFLSLSFLISSSTGYSGFSAGDATNIDVSKWWEENIATDPTLRVSNPIWSNNEDFHKQFTRWALLTYQNKTNRSLFDFLSDTQKEIRDEYQQKIDALEGVKPAEEQTIPGEKIGNFIIRQNQEGKWGIFNLEGESLGLTYDTRDEAIDEIVRSEAESNVIDSVYDELLYYNLEEIKNDPTALERIARESNGIVSKEGGEFEFDPKSNLPELTRSKYHPNIISLANKAFPKYSKIVKDYTDQLLKGPIDPISDDIWNQFSSTGSISQDILTSITRKHIDNPDSLSEREKSIFLAKQAEINKIRETILKNEDVSGVSPLQNTNGEYLTEGNFVNKHSDSRKSDGLFTFVSLSPNEVIMEGNKPVIIDGVIQTQAGTGTEKEKYRRYRNVLNKYSDESTENNFFSQTEDGRNRFRLRLIFPNNENESWYIKTKDKVSILAVIVDQDGTIIRFDNQGNISESGTPVAFEFSTAEYSSQAMKSGIPYIFLSRESVLLNKDQAVITENSRGGIPIFEEIYEQRKKEAAANQTTIDFDPTGDIIQLMKKGVAVYANFDTVLNSKLSSSRINNGYNIEGDPNFEQDAKTINELIEMGFLPAEVVPKIDTTSIGYFANTAEQSLKVGAPYLPVPNSRLRIPVFGKRVKDLTIDGMRIFESEDGSQIYPFGQVIKSIQSKENLVADTTTTDTIYRITIDNFLQKRGKEEGGAYVSIEPKTFQKLYEYLSSLFYSQDIEVIMEYQDETIPYAIKIRDKRTARTPFSEYRINMNEVDFSLQVEEFIFNDDRFKSEEEGVGYTYSYLSFVNENFITTSLPAQIGESSSGKPIINFVKLNRRVIFTLENSYVTLRNKLDNINKPKTETKTSNEMGSLVGRSFSINNTNPSLPIGEFTVVSVENNKITIDRVLPEDVEDFTLQEKKPSLSTDIVGNKGRFVYNINSFVSLFPSFSEIVKPEPAAENTIQSADDLASENENGFGEDSDKITFEC